jgi:hypothetical protein
MTILPFGAARCIDCKAPVAIVRRTVEVPCAFCRQLFPCVETEADHDPHTHAIPDIGPATVVDEQGERHECAA